MTSISIFPTLVYHQPLLPKGQQKTLTSLLKQLRQEIILLSDEDLQGQRWSAKNYRNGYTSYGSRDALFMFSSTFEELRQLIDSHCRQFIKDLEYELGPRDLMMNTLWANIMNKGAYHTMHFHPQSVLSGTFYVETPRPLSPLKFEDPRFGLLMNSPVKKAKAKNSPFFEIQPQAGDLVLFESWLRHEVPQNSARTSRISLSFNYDWKANARR